MHLFEPSSLRSARVSRTLLLRALLSMIAVGLNSWSSTYKIGEFLLVQTHNANALVYFVFVDEVLLCVFRLDIVKRLL